MPFAECWEGHIWIAAASRPWPFVSELCLIHTVVLRVWFVQQESHCSPTATEALQGLSHTHTNTHRWVNFLYYCYVMHRRWTTGSQTHAHKHKHPLSAQRHKHMCAAPGRQGHGARLFLLRCGQNTDQEQHQSQERIITDEFFNLSIASLSKMVRKWTRKAKSHWTPVRIFTLMLVCFLLQKRHSHIPEL